MALKLLCFGGSGGAVPPRFARRPCKEQHKACQLNGMNLAYKVTPSNTILLLSVSSVSAIMLTMKTLNTKQYDEYRQKRARIWALWTYLLSLERRGMVKEGFMAREHNRFKKAWDRCVASIR